MANTIGTCSQLTCSGASTAHRCRCSRTATSAYKRQGGQRAPQFIDLPPLDPNEALPPPNNPQRQNGNGNGNGSGVGPAYDAANPGQGYIQTPNRRQGGYQQFNNDPYFNQNGGWNNHRNRNNNRGGFQGFEDATELTLLQDLEFYNGFGFPSDRWVEDEELEEQDDLEPKYINGRRVLVNREIQASRVRVQNAQKVEIGIMSLDEARELALNSGRADVVLINEGGDPPVVRLMQFSKYKFELERAAKQKQKASKGTEIKEVKLRPVTEPHDFEVKLKAVKGFLSKGSKVKLTMQFSGREMRFKDQGKAMMLKLIEDLSTISKQESPLSLRASTFSVTLAAVK
eukprot:GHRR01000951.1.p1 GENE.GHRR01000951.1~~GHRR01000951.1.p1  ORF type:complete len:343 (+),score=81.00 GHRR01000951.1:185-1213(+)